MTTAKELIDKLSQLPPETLVVVIGNDEDGCFKTIWNLRACFIDPAKDDFEIYPEDAPMNENWRPAVIIE